MSVNELRSKIVPLLKSRGATRVGLFGSAARGQMKPTSDVDILVEIGNDISLLDFVGIKQELEKKLRRRVDLVEYKALKPRLTRQILQEEISLLL